jgi:hypothetical protein
MPGQKSETPDRPPGSWLIAAAWVSTSLTIAALHGGFLLIIYGIDAAEVWGLFVAGGLGVLLSMGLSFWGILRRSGAAGEHLLFDTWFPMFMAAVPLAGPFIALWSAIRLLFLDRLSAATITTSSGSSSSTSHYDAVPLHGSGRPAGLLLIALAALQPMIALTITVEAQRPAGPAEQPTAAAPIPPTPAAGPGPAETESMPSEN